MTGRDADPAALVAALVALLDVEAIDRDLDRGARKPGGVGRVYGGQVIAQALAAAMRTVDDVKVAHSLHAYFMRGGDEGMPIVYRTTRDFDGRSFATRRVVAQQDGVPILVLAASFQLPDTGFAHATPMPAVPPPEDALAPLDYLDRLGEPVPDAVRAFWGRPSPIEVRFADPDRRATAAGMPVNRVWMRVRAGLAHDPRLHRAILAYMSDFALLGTSVRAHLDPAAGATARIASLDHALWLHETPKVDDWLLYACDSPWAGQARGFNRGTFFTRDGRMIASAAQEGMIRPPRDG